MPLARITLRAGTPARTQQAIADGVHKAMVEVIGIPMADRFLIIDERPAGAMMFDPTYLGVHRENAICVEITLAPGRPTETKRAFYRSVADKLHAAGVRREDVFIILHESQRENWSLGNGEAQLLDTELLRRHGWTPPSDDPMKRPPRD
jgi:phenylpyruvate tautomerase PptA (4-oxalocrotonate tautomerase family)